jgi:hypothetical protein
MTTVTNVHPNSTLGVWTNYSYNEWNGTSKGYWYVGHLEGNGCTLRVLVYTSNPGEKRISEGLDVRQCKGSCHTIGAQLLSPKTTS